MPSAVSWSLFFTIPTGISVKLLEMTPVYLLFFLSGAASLILEVSWIRLFANLFGNSAQAITVVLAAFMGGMACGSYSLGRWSDRQRSWLKLYGLLVLGTGLTSFLIPLYLDKMEVLVDWFYRSHWTSPLSLVLLRSLISLALVVPTSLMGATLPVLCKHFSAAGRDFRSAIAGLYGMNLLGASFGGLVTGFFLFDLLGVRSSSYAGSALYVGVGLLSRLPIGNASQESVSDREETERGPGSIAFLLWVSFFIGFSAFAFEILWTRLLEFTFKGGMSVLAFSVMIAVFLFGMALGSLLYPFFVRREKGDSLRPLGWLQLGLGISAVVGLLGLFWLVQGKHLSQGPHFLESSLFLSYLAVASLLMFLPSLFFGFSFPLVCQRASSTFERMGRSVGLFYSINTLGSILGSLLTGFLLIPFLGSEWTFKILVTLHLLLGVSLLLDRRRTSFLLILPVAAALGFWVRADFVLGIINANAETVVAFGEGNVTAVLLVDSGDGIRQIIGGVRGSGTAERYLVTNEALAYVPMALHPEPRRVAVVGFGTGRTSGLYANDPRIQDVDLVEIEPKVFDVGRDVLNQVNLGVLENPKANRVTDDAFNFFKHTDRSYDIISLGEPNGPRYPAAARLFTKDFLSLCRQRLRENGIVILFAYKVGGVRKSTLRVSLKTFQEIFPHTAVWASKDNNSLFLVGSPQPIVADPEAVASRLALRPPLTDGTLYYLKTEDVLNGFVIWEKEIAGFLRSENRVFTVDRPNLEYLIHRDASSRVLWADFPKHAEATH